MEKELMLKRLPRFLKHVCLLCAAFLAPLIVCAQSVRNMPAAANVEAPVPPLQYRSVFADAIGVDEPKQAPDKNWAQSNRNVAGDSIAAPPPPAPRPQPGGATPGRPTPRKAN
jgi:hypothetical protein